MNQLRIAIVDDHQLFSDALKNVLPLYSNIKSVETFTNGDQLMTYIEANTIDLALLDLGIKEGMNGFETLKQLKFRKPEVKTIIVSMHTQKEYVDRIREMGGNGYLAKDCGAQMLKDAISFVMRSNEFYTTLGFGPENPFNQLSKTESEIARQLLGGQSNKQIAETLCRSKETIDTHRKNIYKKLKVNSVVEFIKLGMKFGMSTDDLS